MCWLFRQYLQGRLLSVLPVYFTANKDPSEMGFTLKVRKSPFRINPFLEEE